MFYMEPVIRLRIEKEIFKKYKMLCLDLDLSISKQTEALIAKFVEVQQENNARVSLAKEKK